MIKKNKFLQTITFLGNEMLIPISDIKCIFLNYSEDTFKIIIKGFSETETSECFVSEQKMINRYHQIKKIIGAE